MIARAFTVIALVTAQAMVAGDQRSDLKLTAPHRIEGHPAWFIISAAARKRVLVAVKDAKILSLDISAEFPYSVTLTESPTPRYTTVLMFSDRQKDTVIDSFGVTSSDALERTDADTHQRVFDCAAEGRAIGEKLAKDLWGEHH